MSKKMNPFAALIASNEKKAVIKSLGDYEVTYRELTRKEADEFAGRYLKGYNQETGRPDIDIDEYTKVRYEIVATGLIDPKVTVEDLEKLPAKEGAAILEELGALISPSEVSDEEGN